MPCFRKGRIYENAAIIASATGSSELCADQRGANPRSFHALSGIPGTRFERIYKSREFRSRDGSVGPYHPDSAGDCRMVLSKNLISNSRRTWKKMARNPAVLAIGIALIVIAGVLVFQFVGRLNDFPGSTTARKLLTIAGSTRSVLLDPVSTDAGTLSDLFFLKHGLEHYDVPAEFADFRTLGCRVFEDDESQRIAQIWVAERRMQFFLFPAERNTKTGAVLRFPGWRC